MSQMGRYMRRSRRTADGRTRRRRTGTGLLKKANPQGDANALMQQTEAARKIVRREVWQVLEQTDSTGGGDQVDEPATGAHELPGYAMAPWEP